MAAVERLNQHAGIEQYLLTGQEHYRAAYLWNDLGFSKHFKEILYSAKIGYLKTSPKLLERVNSLLGIAATERPLFFDDQEEVVRLACENGWDACVFNTVEDIRTHPRLKGLLQQQAPSD